jgi:hypothetical protein
MTVLLARAIALAGLCIAFAGNMALGQTSTGSVRGMIRDAAGAPVNGATITANGTTLGMVRTVTTGDNGFYNLAGLRPDRYSITVRRIGFGAQGDSITVGVGQTIQHDVRMTAANVQLEAVTIVASSTAGETRTSEIATNVTQEQINNLPSPDRNFMSLAALAPGVTLQNEGMNGTRKTFQAGAQGADQVNIFIDGASYKNDILQGGVAGQDASRGNPFPRNAVQEFRVLTQNYKAEYQKASSAIITATTKTGGDRWAGNAFYNYLPNRWVELDTFQIRDKRAAGSTFRKPDFNRYQLGLSGGGPLSERFRAFGAYEGSRQERTRRVNITDIPTGFPAIDTINFAKYNGTFEEPFKSTLLFGKVTFDHRVNSTFDLSYSMRSENDIRDFGGMTAYSAATRMQNDVHTAVLKHNLLSGSWLSEATASFQQYKYNPVPVSSDPIARLYGFGCCATIGANRSIQNFKQGRLSLREDLTYSGVTWMGQHVIKGGGNLDFLRYDIEKRNDENPLFVYESWFSNFEVPQRVEYGTGDPHFKTNNNQLGAYIQDDWSPSDRLTLNLGIRWDFESKMLNYDYVTPPNLVAAITAANATFFRPVDLDRYVTDGNDRDPFMGAFQPRVGASYTLTESGRTTVFGGWGMYYDRNIYDLSIEESFALQHPSYRIVFEPPGGDTDPNTMPFERRFLTEGKESIDAAATAQGANNPQAKLIPNDLRPPMSQQFTFGVRHLFGAFALEAAYTGVRSKNTPTFYWANVGFTCPARTDDCKVTRPVAGFSEILTLENAGKTWYDALALKVDRPYRRVDTFGWGAGLAYTLAKRETEGFNDNFSFTGPEDFPRQPRNDERHRVVSNFVVDVPYAFGIQFSGLVTLGSGARYDRGDRHGSIGRLQAGVGEPERDSFIIPNAFAYRNVDLRLRKDFARLRGMAAGVTLDAFNVFNFQNLGCYSSQTVTTDGNFGKAGCVVGDPRRLQLGIEYNF